VPRALTADRADVHFAFCWSHVRRGFYELAVSGPAPIASEALERIAGLYAVEKDIRGRSPEERRAVRSLKSRPRCLSRVNKRLIERTLADTGAFRQSHRGRRLRQVKRELVNPFLIELPGNADHVVRKSPNHPLEELQHRHGMLSRYSVALAPSGPLRVPSKP
jgi:hypothetical protein